VIFPKKHPLGKGEGLMKKQRRELTDNEKEILSRLLAAAGVGFVYAAQMVQATIKERKQVAR
jgi:hypothetical protein